VTEAAQSGSLEDTLAAQQAFLREMDSLELQVGAPGRAGPGWDLEARDGAGQGGMAGAAAVRRPPAAGSARPAAALSCGPRPVPTAPFDAGL
jgi:hypothetical protein